MRDFLNKQFSSFTYLNITQFLGALNDNIYKLLIVFFLIDKLGSDKSHIILSSTGAIFVIPFLLFSSNTGTLADRFSKRNIIVLTKILELLVMAIGLTAFAFESVVGSYLTLFFMATQSAIFGPSKYGIIPEIVQEERISHANGLMTSFTFLAIIVGTFIASFVTDITDRNFIMASLLCTILSLVGVIMSFGIEYTPPSGSLKKFNLFILSDLYQTLKLAKKHPSLLAAIFGSAYFLFLGAFIQLNIIPFAMQSLGLTDIQGGYLFLLTAFGIGAGAMAAGKISGKAVELGMVPLSSAGICLSLFLLDYYSNSLSAIIPLILVLGLLGGIFEIPLDTYIQVASPKDYRGQLIAVTNVLSFFGVLLASAFIYLITGLFGLEADQGFTIMGCLTTAVSIVFSFQFFDYLTRFVGMILSKIHFKTQVEGQEKIPPAPCLYICRHTAWNDTLLLLGAQRRRVRFFIEKEKVHKPWLRRAYRLLKVVMMPPIEAMEEDEACIRAVQKTLAKGISVCIFMEEPEKYRRSGFFRSLSDKIEAPILFVTLEKGEKRAKKSLFGSLLKRLRVPARLSFEKI